jgi:hypothetical protein
MRLSRRAFAAGSAAPAVPRGPSAVRSQPPGPAIAIANRPEFRGVASGDSHDTAVMEPHRPPCPHARQWDTADTFGTPASPQPHRNSNRTSPPNCFSKDCRPATHLLPRPLRNPGSERDLSEPAAGDSTPPRANPATSSSPGAATPAGRVSASIPPVAGSDLRFDRRLEPEFLVHSATSSRRQPHPPCV